MPKEFSLQAERSFIGAWFMDSPSVCDDLVRLFRESPARYPGEIVDYAGKAGVIDKAVKDSVEIMFEPNSSVPEFRRYIVELLKCVKAYTELFPYCDAYAPWHIIQKTNLQFYPPGGGFKIFHTERLSAVPPSSTRHLVFMTYLNDVTDAGGTEFFHQKLTVQPRKGLTLVWPADWTHTHRGIVSPTQEKFIITGWFNYVQPS
ncbi:unnamed protein product [Phaeothamnion confervicola]